LQRKYKSENIQFIIRRIEDNELPVLFGAADTTVIPYREASQSGVLFMSYAFGVPVVAPDIGGFPFDILDRRTGYIFKVGNTTDLKEKLEKVIANKNIELLNSEGIRQYARENYSWEQSGKDLINFIHS
jgi:glycosyltransferase involved in cell wall biosynthesis